MKNKSKQGKKKEPQSTSKAKAGSSKKALKPSDNGCGSSDRCVGSSDAGNLLTPKRDGVCPPESFGLDGVRFMVGERSLPFELFHFFLWCLSPPVCSSNMCSVAI